MIKRILGKHVLLSVEKGPEEVTASGIALPASRATISKVVAIGKIEGEISIGDRVIWDKNARMAVVRYDDKEYYLFDEKDIICVIGD